MTVSSEGTLLGDVAFAWLEAGVKVAAMVAALYIARWFALGRYGR